MADQLLAGIPPVLDNNGDIVAGGSVTFYETGTTTLVDIFSDIAGTVPLTNPLTLDSAGRPAQQIFYVGSVAVKEVIKDAGGATLYTVDPSPRFSVTSAAASGITYSPIAANPNTDVQAAINFVSEAASVFPSITGNAGKAPFVNGGATTIEYINSLGYLCTATGTNIVALATGLDLNTITNGVSVGWLQEVTNTGAATVSIDNVVAAPLVLNDGSAIPAGKLIAGDYYAAAYDGTNWVLGNATGIDGTVIGALSPAAGAFVVLDAIGADSSTTGLTIENTAGEQLRQYFTDGTAGADFNIDYNGTGVSDIVITSAGAVTIPGFVGEKFSLGEIHRDTTAAGATAWSPASTAARLIIVELIGGGAGAGGAKSNVSGNVAVSGGGGAGARAVLAIDLSTHTAPFSYTIGAGGGGTGIGSNGNNGGDTTITISATTSTAGGGVGSLLNTEDSDPNGRSGGAGGANATLTAITGASVILDEYGEAGELGFGVPSVSVTGTGFGVGGRGGGAFDRANSITNNNNNGNNGSAGRNPGDGGGGASSTGTNASSNAGGDGADGSIVIYVYY